MVLSTVARNCHEISSIGKIQSFCAMAATFLTLGLLFVARASRLLSSGRSARQYMFQELVFYLQSASRCWAADQR